MTQIHRVILRRRGLVLGTISLWSVSSYRLHKTIYSFPISTDYIGNEMSMYGLCTRETYIHVQVKSGKLQNLILLAQKAVLLAKHLTEMYNI